MNYSAISTPSTAAPRSHQRWLAVFVAVVALHWVEHLAQAAQIYLFGWARPDALGFIGFFAPVVIKSEALHFSYAVIMLVGLFLLRKGMHVAARPWWTVALLIQAWHFVEHAVLQCQYLFNANLMGRRVPTSFVQLWLPRVELHVLYNLIVLVPMMLALSLHWFRPEDDPLPVEREAVSAVRLGSGVTP